MSIRPLVIDDNAKRMAQKVIAYAEAHKLNIHEVMRRVGDPTIPAVGDDPGFRTILPFGYRCCFSIEQQPKGWMRHLSVSVQEKNVGPSPAAMEEIMKMFGFTCGLKDCDGMALEKGDYLAINVLQLIK